MCIHYSPLHNITKPATANTPVAINSVKPQAERYGSPVLILNIVKPKLMIAIKIAMIKLNVLMIFIPSVPPCVFRWRTHIIPLLYVSSTPHAPPMHPFIKFFLDMYIHTNLHKRYEYFRIIAKGPPYFTKG